MDTKASASTTYFFMFIIYLLILASFLLTDSRLDSIEESVEKVGKCNPTKTIVKTTFEGDKNYSEKSKVITYKCKNEAEIKVTK